MLSKKKIIINIRRSIIPDILLGRITNSTNENIMVFGPRRDDGNWHNSGYILIPEQTTPIFLDCDGFLLPNDRYFISTEGWEEEDLLAALLL